MRKNPLKTPKSRVKAALRQLWLRSRERNYALRRDKYTCQVCHEKQSKAKGKEVKVQVHHKEGIMWEEIINYIYEQLLVNPDKLVTLCEKCHQKAYKV
jgi:5-methylcytosine-specific restriction endonuclease McrA